MLNHSFIHLPGVGVVTENQIWESGATTWEKFLSVDSVPTRIQNRRVEMRQIIRESVDRLQQSDAWFFGKSLPSREQWRLYADFRDRAAYLDIETTGLSPARSEITMVGILDSDGFTAYVQGENLEDLREALEKYDLVVTYNGASFDLPFIEYHFGKVFTQVSHIDLRYPLKRLGFQGGLKSIETQAGVARPSELGSLDGFDAVLMWGLWQQGDAGAKDTLIRYNAEDVVSLPALTEIVYNRLSAPLPVPCEPLEPAARHNIDLPFDIDVIRELKKVRTRYGAF